MKQLLHLISVLTCFWLGAASAYAQKVQNIVFAGSGFYVETGASADYMEKQGYTRKAKPAVTAGIGFRIPLNKFYIKPAFTLDYLQNSYEKTSETVKDMTAAYRNSNGKMIKYNTERESFSRKSISSRGLSAIVPVAFGYGFDFGEKPITVDLGAMLYASCVITSHSVEDSYSRISYHPFHASYGSDEKATTSSHDKNDKDMTKDIEFKDRVSYGAGLQATMGYKRFRIEYSMLYDLRMHFGPNKQDGNWFCHLFTVGYAF